MAEPYRVPEVIDNQTVTLAEVLEGAASDPSLATPPVSIATGFVNLGGLATIDGLLQQSERVRILIGAEPQAGLDNGSAPIRGLPVAQAINRLREEMEGSRDELPFNTETAEQVLQIAKLLSAPTVEIRRHTDRFLHGKVYIFGGRVVIAGSNNLTTAGLNYNLEFAASRQDNTPYDQATRWFDELWESSGDYKRDLIDILAARDLETYTPHQIYLRALLELYQPELALLRDGEEFEAQEPGGLNLTEFQRHGVQRAIRIIDRFDGAIIADGVGLGKSFMGTRLLDHYVNEIGGRALVVVPASLRDSFWKTHVKENEILADVISFQELAEDHQLGPGLRNSLTWKKDTYSFVLVDEAHAFRHPDTKQYRALSRLMGGRRKRMALMTATPVNNSLQDLYHQIMLFARHTARFKSLGIPDLQRYFKDAQAMTGSEAAISATFKLMDAVSVRRTRRFIEKHYPNAKLANGEVVSFPNPVLRTERYDLDSVYPGLFELVARHMGDGLNFARYQPDNYRLDQNEDPRAQTLAGLLRTSLLKRFESSVFAFRETLTKMIVAHDEFLTALADGWVLVPADRVVELEGDEGDENPADAIERLGSASNPAADYHGETLKAEVEVDREKLRELLSAVKTADIENDPKLAALETILTERITDNDEKVIIFSYYADTARWIQQALEHDAASGGLRFGNRPFVTVTGSASLSTNERLRRVASFCPETQEITPTAIGAENNLLIATDTLAEGHNLQQARHIINFDMPWNPMRLVQRNGRIDRIGSPWAGEDVFLFNLFPLGDLDKLLKLYEILLRKITAARFAVGIESPVIDDDDVNDVNFAETKDQIEKIAEEDGEVLRAAENQIDAFSGEEFRMELRNALAQGIVGGLERLPHGVGSGFESVSIPDEAVGIFFGARLLLGDRARPSVHDVRAWHYVDLDDQGNPVTDELEILARIKCATATQRIIDDRANTSIHEIWARLQTNIAADFNRALDPAGQGVRLPESQRWATDLISAQVESLTGTASVEMKRLRAASASLSVPRSPTILRQLSRIRRLVKDEEETPLQGALEVLAVVEDEGLRPPDEESATVAQLTPERVRLICFQIVSGCAT